MTWRHLRTRFLLSSGLLVLMTAASGAWGVLALVRLGEAVDASLDESEVTIALAASLATAIEREDDALLRVTTGQAPDDGGLATERRRFEQAFARLVPFLKDPDERMTLDSIRRHADGYRAAVDRMLATSGRQESWAEYHVTVNPALRHVVADCDRVRELHFRSMRQTGVQARDRARRAAVIVGVILAAAVASSILVASRLARAVVPPVLDLTRSVEALGRGDLGRRVSVTSADELGRLASGFNQMAETLAEFRRLDLDEVFRAKETLESTLAALPDAVIVIDPEGDIVAANPTASSVFRALGLGTVRRLEQLPLSRDSLDAVRGQLRGDPAEATRPDLERVLPVALNGHLTKLLPTVMPIPEFSAGRPGAVVVLYDVTEFARLDELRTEMIAVASHELKTPLTTLRMNLMLLRERTAELSPLLREIVSTAALGCEELAATIDELLDLTRIEAGQLRPNLEQVDIVALAGHIADKFLPRFEENEVRLDFVRGCEQAFVPGDAARLGVVLSNLLTNALKYTPREGRVEISVTPECPDSAPDFVQLAVTDTGPGIPPEFRERVFEKFFRLDHLRPGSGEGVQGVGIGLYLCRQIVALHGGRMRCAGGAEHIGARFVIELPSSTLAPR
jgi:NtrC-family two-component system sensor histidine kinase KinB